MKNKLMRPVSETNSKPWFYATIKVSLFVLVVYWTQALEVCKRSWVHLRLTKALRNKVQDVYLYTVPGFKSSPLNSNDTSVLITGGIQPNRKADPSSAYGEVNDAWRFAPVDVYVLVMYA